MNERTEITLLPDVNETVYRKVDSEVKLLKNCYPLDGKLGIGDLTPLQCRYDFGRQTLVGTAEGSTVSFKFVTFSFELNK